MNPWIAGRIIETMQQEARARGEEARLGRGAAPRPPRKARIGLAVARIGLRLAGESTHAAPRDSTRLTPHLGSRH
jgi:hypothetical protein